MKLLLTIVICFFIWLHFGANEKTREVIPVNSQKITNSIHTNAQVSSPSETKNSSEQENIEKTLRLVAENWKKTDVNGDGLINCIDAAVLFYQYYPDKNKVCIEVNKNPNSEMHHLFNCVFTDGVWKAIEPQAYAINHSYYLMKAVWRNRYDNSYNRDVTADYLRYVRK